MKALTLALLWPAMTLSAAESSPWKIDNQPALTPGVLGEWDDWAVVNPTILKRADKWWMFYEGMIFDEKGVRSAFGIAQSNDELTWRKHSQNPLFTPTLSETQSCSSPSVAWWHNAFWLIYIASEDPYRAALAEKNPTGEAPVTARLARSEDGLIWHEMAGVHPPISSKFPYPFRPCLYTEGDALHLWWVGPSGERDQALFHSISRDGKTWSQPNQQPLKELDSREVFCARVYPLGDYYVLSYVAYDESKHQYFAVTKTSRNARSWIANGPPEFQLPPHSERASPWLVFDSGGSRLFFSAPKKNNTQELRSAYCRKESYATP